MYQYLWLRKLHAPTSYPNWCMYPQPSMQLPPCWPQHKKNVDLTDSVTISVVIRNKVMFWLTQMYMWECLQDNKHLSIQCVLDAMVFWGLAEYASKRLVCPFDSILTFAPTFIWHTIVCATNVCCQEINTPVTIPGAKRDYIFHHVSVFCVLLVITLRPLVLPSQMSMLLIWFSMMK